MTLGLYNLYGIVYYKGMDTITSTGPFTYITLPERRRAARLYAAERSISMSDTPFDDLSRADQLAWVRKSESK